MYDTLGRIYTFRTRRFVVEVDALVEEEQPADHFDNADYVASIEAGEIEWFAVRARVRHAASGAILGADYLGGCAYRSWDEFRNTPGYFGDVVREAVGAARATIAELVGAEAVR